MSVGDRINFLHKHSPYKRGQIVLKINVINANVHKFEQISLTNNVYETRDKLHGNMSLADDSEGKEWTAKG
jgi:hypothetical protein